MGIGMKVDFRAGDRARAIVASLGRTEDVRFSPSNRRLAIAAAGGKQGGGQQAKE